MMLHGFSVYLFISVVTWCSGLAAAQNVCAKIDFNRTISQDFVECHGKYQPIFVIKDYATHRELKPYRPTSRYFLSNNFDMYSCGETRMHFSLNAESSIEASIFFKSIGNAFFEIIVYDSIKNVRVTSVRSDGTAGWFILRDHIRSNIQNARVSEEFQQASSFAFNIFVDIVWIFLFQVDIIAYMTPQSILAIEYIHILNSGIKTPECAGPPATTYPPAQRPPGNNDNNKNDNNWVVIVISVCVGILFLVLFFVALFCILDTHRKRAHCSNK